MLTKDIHHLNTKLAQQSQKFVLQNVLNTRSVVLALKATEGVMAHGGQDKVTVEVQGRGGGADKMQDRDAPKVEVQLGWRNFWGRKKGTR